MWNLQSFWGQAFIQFLTFIRPMLHPYTNQSTDLNSKSIVWFLYECKDRLMHCSGVNKIYTKFSCSRNDSLRKKSLTLPVPIPDEDRKLTKIFIFTLLCGASKAFIKSFEAPQRKVKMKIYINFLFNISLWNIRGGKV